MIRLTAIRETDVLPHHGGLIENRLKLLIQLQHYGIVGFKGGHQLGLYYAIRQSSLTAEIILIRLARHQSFTRGEVPDWKKYISYITLKLLNNIVL